LTKSATQLSVAEDVDLGALGRALWRAKKWIIGLALGAGAATFIVLSMMRPLYTSEARILIQNEESAFTRPADDQGRDRQQALDEQAIQSQVQVITSRDIALEVVKELGLAHNAEFAKDAGTSFIKRWLSQLGLGLGSPKSEEEKAANALADHLSVFVLNKSSVISIEYTSGDPQLAADIANKIAEDYLEWQRKEKMAQTQDATVWLNSQIEVLRKRVAESEEAAERFRASNGLYEGSNNVPLNAQQLSELNSQLIQAAAQKSEAEARARLIKKMLADGGDIDATPEVLNSELIGRLIEQRAQVQRQLAELSATLLPSHPRIQQLNSELADIRGQIRDEATKIVKSLENQAEVASARESSLSKSLNDVKSQASGQSDAEIKLRALEREAKSNRDLLESYLARYRDASARHDMGAVPAQAAIVSKAHASIQPSFPKRMQLTLLVTAAVALLALAFVMARELIGEGGTSESRPVPRGEARRERRRSPPAPAVAASYAARSASRQGPPTEPVAVKAAVLEPVTFTPMPASPPATIGSPAAETVATSAASAVDPEAKASGETAVAASESAPPEKAPSMLSSWLGTVKTKSAAKDTEHPLSIKLQPKKNGPSAGEFSAAAGLLSRLRRKPSSTPAPEAQEATSATSQSLLDRLRGIRAPAADKPEDVPNTDGKSPPAEEAPPLRSNDLRAYLAQRMAAPAPRPARAASSNLIRAVKAGNGKVGPVLKSFDAVLDHVLAAGKGIAPRAVLVAASAPKADAAQIAVKLARALAVGREQVVLADLTRGSAAVSGPLHLPRAPGFTDLLAERAGFEDVVRIDQDTPLQVIPAGNPNVVANGDETERFTRLFEALTQAYDCVVLHADRDMLRALTTALRFELPLMVVVLPQGTTVDGASAELDEFSSLGCPVMIFEQGSKTRRAGLLSRVAAV
jgi:uncharacterized protein involved in exopolysaccharide biosynthesis/Mrp family chromosome partitioning ATPase